MFPFYLLLTAAVYAFGFIAFRFAQVDVHVFQEPPEAREPDWAALGAHYSAECDRLSFWRDPLLSISAAAKALDTSEARLSKAINLGLGTSFSIWINRRRVEQVAAMLQEDLSVPVMEIAAQCGFNSKATFNRWFREVKGCTPSEFRSSRSVSSRAPEQHLA